MYITHMHVFLKKANTYQSLHAFYTEQYIQPMIDMCTYNIYISITTFK